MLSVQYIFESFDMVWPGTEPRSSGPLANNIGSDANTEISDIGKKTIKTIVFLVSIF